MQVEIITPESEVFKGEAEAVQFPGLDGSFQVLNGHAPIISALSNGSIKINLVNTIEDEAMNDNIEVDSSDKKVVYIAIKGGVIEMLNNKIIVLAE